MPGFLRPQLATLVDEPPQGAQWWHEVKFDGYRMWCVCRGGRARFVSRNNQDWTARFAALAAGAAEMPVDTALFDGEVVADARAGVSSFQVLQNAFREGQAVALQYYVFDLLYLNGWDLRALTLAQRKVLLSELFDQPHPPSWRLSVHFQGNPNPFFARCCRHGLEGIVSKRVDLPFVSGRTRDWVKIKCAQQAEFVIGGFTDPERTRTGLGALLLGYYEPDGRLIYSGRVGTGFDNRELAALRAQLQRIERRQSPFANFAGAGARNRGVHWVRPTLVAQIRFSNWTQDGLLRQPTYLGLREDKPAREVRREVPSKLPRTRKTFATR